ncbi:hypothetical protein PENANT_c039G05353 [Penicillium antarcticum]|uniref:FAD-binding domain-containing protein n=1 Tax=Penicillium antarcticum TaxID=416450 RepID=A0A1V6PTQ8_9EURO|nr:hypothetical protein PENANT_c039G05353 [Penicillium antarcticum]
MAQFRVIIVGGGITGLALANMLERYHIDFAVSEKHEDLTETRSWIRYGARIPDQLGCFEKLESLSMPVNSVAGYDNTGRLCTYLPDIGSWLEESRGYKMAFLERRQVLQVLYDNLRDKSKIHSSCKALDITLTDTGVQVETEGGVFDGDIVIGVDGVHSHVRREMERLALAVGLEELFRREEGEQQ